jgi:cytochrome P450
MSNTASAVPTVPSGVPTFAEDLHTDELLLDPYPLWERMREAGPVVWLEHHEMFAVTRYAELVEAASDWKAFASGHGVGMSDAFNDALAGKFTLMMDPPEHDRCRRANGNPLLPRNVEGLEPRLRTLAQEMVADVRGRERFDGVADFAAVMPLTIVRDLVGLPDDGREQMLTWGTDGFNAFGMLDNERTQRGLQGVQAAFEYMMTVRDRITPGSWGDHLLQAEQRGELGEGEGVMLMNDYVFPSLDTTIHALSAGLRLFAENPDQWALLREDRSLLPDAISEVLRVGAPIQWLTRMVVEDRELGGVRLPAGSRVVLLYASGNRDERKFPEPDRFDITRKPTGHLSFGKGKHACLGMPLARLEMQVLFDVMADEVERIEIGEARYEPNNSLHGLGSLEVTFS